MRRFWLAWLAAAAIVPVACVQHHTTTIAVIPKGTSHVFWKSVHAGAVKAAQEQGVAIVWQGPQREDDRTLQIEVVQNFISRGVSAIVLAPLDETALVRPVEAALKRGIKVVIIDSDLKSGGYSSFVATDNYAGGKMAARRLAELIGGTGNVLMMRYVEGSASTANRERGFLDGMKEFAPAAVLVSTDQYGGATAESALQAGQNLLNKYTSLAGIFCPNESSTFGMLRALETAGKAGAIKFVGFDASGPLLSGLQSGKIQGLIVQDPFKMGYVGVTTAVAALKGAAVEKRIDTGVRLITPENVGDPQIKELIAPDLKRWLAEEK
ncbi:MAG: substrate-binding domain-containing protein [Chitinivibrionales bacterium]|nr:substrate-binding domain-containing protein [Chitinivibrionales bacterium]